MGARGFRSRPAGRYFESFDSPQFPPEKGSWPRYYRDETIPPHLMRRLKHKRIPPTAQNYLEALAALDLVDDPDLDEIAELNPEHPTIVRLKSEGDW
jgi:hypothetical protein